MGQTRMSLVTIDGVATECAGLTVWWQLCRKVECARFEKAWQLSGLPQDVLLAPPSSVAVLERTMTQLFSDRQTIVKPVKGQEGFYAVLPKGVDGSNLPEYKTEWTAGIKKVLRGSNTEEVLEISSSCPVKTADQLETMFDCNLDTFGSREQSQLMTGVVRWLSGARLQQAGKLYFLPPDKVESWRKVEGVLQAASGITTYEIPALPAKSAMKAVLHAITSEAKDVAMELEEELSGFLRKGTSRQATLDRRRETAEEMRDKLSYYESFLGEQMTELKDRLDKIALACVKSDLVTSEVI